MKFEEVAENVTRLVEELLAYGSPKSGVTLQKNGTRNLSKVPGEVLWKNKVWFKNVVQASRLPNVPQASSLPDGAKSPQDAGGTSSVSQASIRPDSLRAAHHHLDQAVDRLYRSKPFASDEERLEHLFKLYEEMIATEQLV